MTIGPETLKWALNGPVDIIILVVFTDCFANRVVVKWKRLGSELLSISKILVLSKIYDLDFNLWRNSKYKRARLFQQSI